MTAPPFFPVAVAFCGAPGSADGVIPAVGAEGRLVPLLLVAVTVAV